MVKSFLKRCGTITALAAPIAALALAGLGSSAVSHAEDDCDYSFYLNYDTNLCQFCDDSMSWNYDTNQCLAYGDVDVYLDPNPVLGPLGPIGVGPDPILGPVGPVGVGPDPVLGPVGPVGVGGPRGPVGPVVPGFGRR